MGFLCQNQESDRILNYLSGSRTSARVRSWIIRQGNITPVETQVLNSRFFKTFSFASQFNVHIMAECYF